MVEPTHFVYIFIRSEEKHGMAQSIATWMTHADGHVFNIDDDEDPLKFKFFQSPGHVATQSHHNDLTFFFKTYYSDMCVKAAIARFTRQMMTHLRAAYPGLVCSHMTNRILEQVSLGH